MTKPLLVFVLLSLAACGTDTPSPEAVPAASAQTRPADPALASEGDLDGRFFVSGPIGEGDLVRDSSHFYVWLEGASAAELYRRIRGAPIERACEDGHAWAKHGRSLVCTTDADSTEHRCYFALDVAEEELAAGVSC